MYKKRVSFHSEITFLDLERLQPRVLMGEGERNFKKEEKSKKKGNSLCFYQVLSLGVLDSTFNPSFPSFLIYQLSLDYNVLSCECWFLVLQV